MENARKPYEIPEIKITEINSDDIIVTSPLKDDEGEYSPIYPL